MKPATLLLAGLLAGAPLPASAQAPVELTFTGEHYHLISPGPGPKDIRVTASAAGPLPEGTLRLELRGYDSAGAQVERRVLAKAEAPLAAEVVLPVTIPQLGLFDLSLQALDPQGRLLASGSATYAAIPPRTDVGPSDFGVATHFGFTDVQDDLGQIPRVLDLIKAAGFAWIRDEISWSTVERTKGIFTFGPHHDAYIGQTVTRGLSPLLILTYGNGAVYPEEFKGSKGFPETPGARAAFVRYALELVKRHGDKVKHWEVWNEPHAWGKPTVENYTLLLKEVSAAVKKADPQAYIIGCGGGGAGGGPSGDYAAAVIRHGGLESMDGFSIHPYISPPGSPDIGYPAKNSPIGPRVNIPDVWQHLGRFIAHENHRKADGRRLELWVTEFGAYSAPVSWVKGEPFQAAFLARAYLLSRRYQTARALFWYNFYDKGVRPDNIEDNFGLVRRDYTAKPAYVAAAVLTATLGDKPWTRAHMDNANVKVLEYGQGAGRVIAGWTVQQFIGETVTLRLPPGPYTLRDWQGRDSDIVIGDKGYEWQLRALPQYLIPRQ